VIEALGFAFERWDGKGIPNGVRGESIPLAMRVVTVTTLS
jgi:response regulator RpfG family c-di-GMP phosphodiesterase